MMKKGIVVIAAFALFSCEKEQPKVIKLDYTSNYESAAYALVSAKTNYRNALQSSDAAAIATAKQKLDEAQNTYNDTKRKFVKEGGKPVVDVEEIQPKPTQKTPVEKPAVPEPAVNLPPVIRTPQNPVVKTPTIATENAAKRKARRDSINNKIKNDIEAMNARTAANLKKSNDSAKARFQRFGKKLESAFKIKK